MGYIDEPTFKPWPRRPWWAECPPEISLQDMLTKYAWTATYYDNLKLTKTIEDVYKSFTPLPKQTGAETEDGSVETQLPGYTIEGAMAKEIYWRLFARPPPLLEGKSLSPAEEAGQVYLRGPWTFIKDFRPQLSAAPASPAVLEELRRKIPEVMEQKILTSLRARDFGSEDEIANTTKILIDKIPTRYLDILSISNGVYGIGCEESTMLSPAEDILADFDPSETFIALRKNFGEGGRKHPKFGKNLDKVVTGFKIASSPKAVTSYIVLDGNIQTNETIRWAVVRVLDRSLSLRPDLEIDLWTITLRAMVEHDNGRLDGWYYGRHFPPRGDL